jgi:tRNA threonylcarbamoyl adenosine modification protein YeaZ
MHKPEQTRQSLGLSVETSGRQGSVAVGLDGTVLGQVCFSGPMRHSAELFPAVAGLLNTFSRAAADIRHVYISAGPGSFTGIRIAVTFAKAMHFANNAKVVAVNTLDLIAANADDFIRDEGIKIEKVAILLDAKRAQFFVAVFCRRDNRWVKHLPDCLMTSAEFTSRFAGGEPIWLLGEGLLYHNDAFKAPGINIMNEKYWLPRAAALYRLAWQLAEQGKFADPITLVPFYLRNPDVKPPTI